MIPATLTAHALQGNGARPEKPLLGASRGWLLVSPPPRPHTRRWRFWVVAQVDASSVGRSTQLYSLLAKPRPGWKQSQT